MKNWLTLSKFSCLWPIVHQFMYVYIPNPQVLWPWDICCSLSLCLLTYLILSQNYSINKEWYIYSETLQRSLVLCLLRIFFKTLLFIFIVFIIWFFLNTLFLHQLFFFTIFHNMFHFFAFEAFSHIFFFLLYVCTCYSWSISASHLWNCHLTSQCS